MRRKEERGPVHSLGFRLPLYERARKKEMKAGMKEHKHGQRVWLLFLPSSSLFQVPRVIQTLVV